MSSRVRPTDEFESFRNELERLWRSDAELIVARSVGSTNPAVRERLERRTTSRPLVVVAWEQTRGRGRRGRIWRSAPGGGLWASIGARLEDRSSLERLPLLVPVAVAHALRAAGAAGVRLKWPNDLVVGDRKLGGVLVEAVSSGVRPAATVVGVGVNLAPPGDAGLVMPAVGLAELIEPPPRLADLARTVLEPLLEALREVGETAPLVEAYRALSIHRPGETMSCRTATETLDGDFLGFDGRGFLRLRLADGERRIGSGEIVES